MNAEKFMGMVLMIAGGIMLIACSIGWSFMVLKSMKIIGGCSD